MERKQNHLDRAGYDRGEGARRQKVFRIRAALGSSILLLIGLAAVLGSACGASANGATPKNAANSNGTAVAGDPSPFDFSPGEGPALPAEYAFDQQKAWDFLVKQCEFGPRNPGSAAHKKCRDYIQDELKKNCENVRLQELSHKWSVDGKTYTMWNILGEQNWKDAKVRVVVLAHWDTRPDAPQEMDTDKAKKPILGANDGASGVAVLLELARAMKSKLPKDLGILYLMTDGEDLGPDLDEMFLGAVHFSKNLPKPKPNYGILLDMIGDKSLSIPVEPNSYAAAQDIVQQFYRVARSAGFKDAFPSTFGPSISDDHLSLIEAGIPTMDLIDFDYGPNHSWWHTQEDTVDKCSANSLGTVGKAMEAWLSQTPVWSRRSWLEGGG